MAWSNKRRTNLSDDLNILLGDLCREWGFCNQLAGEDLVADGTEVTAEIFADAILAAEGMSPEYELEWARKLRRKFTERYGSSISQKNLHEYAWLRRRQVRLYRKKKASDGL